MIVLLWILVAVIVALGFLGMFLPALPGIPLVFLGLVGAAAMDHFERVGVLTLVVLGVLTLFSFGVDFLASMVGVKRAGASKEAVIGLIIGSVLGIFMGFPGILTGPLLGAFIGELIANPDLHKAAKVGLYAWLGFLVGTVFKLAIGIVMIAVFLISFYR